MKKEGFIIIFIVGLFISLLTIPIVFAQDENIDKAYSCLESKVKNNCPKSVEEQAFTVLSIGKCSSELKDKGEDNECWPAGVCRLKDTALAILALNKIGKDTENAENWLLEQKKIPKDLVWYLEIDSNGETECKISYNGKEKTISIGEDKKISGFPGACLSLAQDDYWLKIDKDCYDVNFTISCNRDFKTTLLYKKTTGSTIYVSSRTNTAAAEGSTEEKVNSFCFGQTSCDYEGSLWATLALSNRGYDIASFLPYLIAMEDENEKYFPSAFLFIITDYDEYFSKIIDKANNYWKITDSPYSLYYDTALALLALYGTPSEQIETAKEYLFSVQDEEGCWNGIRDTAFLLYALNPKKTLAIEGGDIDYCDDYGYYCVSPLECSMEDKLDNFYCYGGKVCCKTQPKEETCYEKGGVECGEDQKCTGAIVPASDTDKCCKGSCITKEEITECEEEGFECRYDCFADEEKKEFNCGADKVCCGKKLVEEKKSYWWIWLLIILIILVILAIIFRNQLRIWIFRFKNKFRKGGVVSTTRPRGFPPFPQETKPRSRMILPARPVQRPSLRRVGISKTDKELDETLKKLREISK